MADYQLTPEEQRKLNGAVDELVSSLIRQDAETQFRKDVAETMREQLNFKTSELNALAKERFEHKASENVEKNQAIVDLNSMLENNCKSSTPE